MKVNELLEKKDDPKKNKKGFIKRADDWMRGSWLQQQIDTAQKQTGRRGPASYAKPVDDKKKVVTKKKKQLKAKNTKINYKEIPDQAQFKDSKGTVWTFNKSNDIWQPNVNTEVPMNPKDGAIAFNSAKPGDRIFYESILKEGGNIFQGTSDFDQKIIPDMMKQINAVLSKTGVKALPIGSGATPTPGKMSGDLDMIADGDQLVDFFKVKDVKTAKVELEKMFQKAGFETRKAGQQVHVKTNIGGQSQQVDIMVVPQGETAQKFHVHDLPKGSPYKGLHKQIIIADLAKEKGAKWSPYKGLVNRDTNELISSNLDEVAKELLGPQATAKDLGSVEAIVKAYPPAQQFVDKYEEDPNSMWNQKKVKPTESTELERIISLARQ